ncbi:uncharacterized protein [Littorina saxatilis]|uniref:uncharacterized protein n=1 Tax=Littorina saxatilis TaxID=31220 RepID=UPI0038B6781E
MGKKYSQSSNYSNQGRSSNAANGNTSGLYDANNCIHTVPVQQRTHWWQVDLGGTFPVYNITVWGRANYWNNPYSRLYPFTITVDGQTCVSVTSAAGNRKNSVTCSSVMYGRVVRLNVATPGRMLNLCELQILVCKEGFYGLDCSTSCDTNCDGRCNRITGHCTQNVAKGKTCRQISTYSNKGAASHAADGNTEGDFFKGSCIHTAENDPPGVNHWWEVDLGGTYPVHDITVWARDGRTSQIGTYWNDHLYPFTITVDNKTCVRMVSAPSTGRSKSVTCSSVVYGRVVRLTLERTGQTLNLCEFQVFGKLL